LYKAVRNHNGVLPVKLAESMYSSKSTAHSAIDKLELAGYIERKTPGYWKVVKITEDIKQEIKHERQSSGDSGDADDNEKKGGKYEKIPV